MLWMLNYWSRTPQRLYALGCRWCAWSSAVTTTNARFHRSLMFSGEKCVHSGGVLPPMTRARKILQARWFPQRTQRFCVSHYSMHTFWNRLTQVSFPPWRMLVSSTGEQTVLADLPQEMTVHPTMTTQGAVPGCHILQVPTIHEPSVRVVCVIFGDVYLCRFVVVRNRFTSLLVYWHHAQKKHKNP